MNYVLSDSDRDVLIRFYLEYVIQLINDFRQTHLCIRGIDNEVLFKDLVIFNKNINGNLLIVQDLINLKKEV